MSHTSDENDAGTPEEESTGPSRERSKEKVKEPPKRSSKDVPRTLTVQPFCRNSIIPPSSGTGKRGCPGNIVMDDLIPPGCRSKDYDRLKELFEGSNTQVQGIKIQRTYRRCVTLTTQECPNWKATHPSKNTCPCSAKETEQCDCLKQPSSGPGNTKTRSCSCRNRDCVKSNEETLNKKIEESQPTEISEVKDNLESPPVLDNIETRPVLISKTPSNLENGKRRCTDHECLKDENPQEAPEPLKQSASSQIPEKTSQSTDYNDLEKPSENLGQTITRGYVCKNRECLKSNEVGESYQNPVEEDLPKEESSSTIPEEVVSTDDLEEPVEETVQPSSNLGNATPGGYKCKDHECLQSQTEVKSEEKPPQRLSKSASSQIPDDAFSKGTGMNEAKDEQQSSRKSSIKSSEEAQESSRKSSNKSSEDAQRSSRKSSTKSAEEAESKDTQPSSKRSSIKSSEDSKENEESSRKSSIKRLEEGDFKESNVEPLTSNLDNATPRGYKCKNRECLSSQVEGLPIKPKEEEAQEPTESSEEPDSGQVPEEADSVEASRKSSTNGSEATNPKNEEIPKPSSNLINGPPSGYKCKDHECLKSTAQPEQLPPKSTDERYPEWFELPKPSSDNVTPGKYKCKERECLKSGNPQEMLQPVRSSFTSKIPVRSSSKEIQVNSSRKSIDKGSQEAVVNDVAPSSRKSSTGSSGSKDGQQSSRKSSKEGQPPSRKSSTKSTQQADSKETDIGDVKRSVQGITKTCPRKDRCCQCRPSELKKEDSTTKSIQPPSPTGSKRSISSRSPSQHSEEIKSNHSAKKSIEQIIKPPSITATVPFKRCKCRNAQQQTLEPPQTPVELDTKSNSSKHSQEIKSEVTESVEPISKSNSVTQTSTTKITEENLENSMEPLKESLNVEDVKPRCKCRESLKLTEEGKSEQQKKDEEVKSEKLEEPELTETPSSNIPEETDPKEELKSLEEETIEPPKPPSNVETRKKCCKCRQSLQLMEDGKSEQQEEELAKISIEPTPSVTETAPSDIPEEPDSKDEELKSLEETLEPSEPPANVETVKPRCKCRESLKLKEEGKSEPPEEPQPTPSVTETPPSDIPEEPDSKDEELKSVEETLEPPEPPANVETVKPRCKCRESLKLMEEGKSEPPDEPEPTPSVTETPPSDNPEEPDSKDEELKSLEETLEPPEPPPNVETVKPRCKCRESQKLMEEAKSEQHEEPEPTPSVTETPPSDIPEEPDSKEEELKYLEEPPEPPPNVETVKPRCKCRESLKLMEEEKSEQQELTQPPVISVPDIEEPKIEDTASHETYVSALEKSMCSPSCGDVATQTPPPNNLLEDVGPVGTTEDDIPKVESQHLSELSDFETSSTSQITEDVGLKDAESNKIIEPAGKPAFRCCKCGKDKLKLEEIPVRKSVQLISKTDSDIVITKTSLSNIPEEDSSHVSYISASGKSLEQMCAPDCGDTATQTLPPDNVSEETSIRDTDFGVAPQSVELMCVPDCGDTETQTISATQVATQATDLKKSAEVMCAPDCGNTLTQTHSSTNVLVETPIRDTELGVLGKSVELMCAPDCGDTVTQTLSSNVSEETSVHDTELCVPDCIPTSCPKSVLEGNLGNTEELTCSCGPSITETPSPIKSTDCATDCIPSSCSEKTSIRDAEMMCAPDCGDTTTQTSSIKSVECKPDCIPESCSKETSIQDYGDTITQTQVPEETPDTMGTSMLCECSSDDTDFSALGLTCSFTCSSSNIPKEIVCVPQLDEPLKCPEENVPVDNKALPSTTSCVNSCPKKCYETATIVRNIPGKNPGDDTISCEVTLKVLISLKPPDSKSGQKAEVDCKCAATSADTGQEKEAAQTKTNEDPQGNPFGTDNIEQVLHAEQINRNFIFSKHYDFRQTTNSQPNPFLNQPDLEEDTMKPQQNPFINQPVEHSLYVCAEDTHQNPFSCKRSYMKVEEEKTCNKYTERRSSVQIEINHKNPFYSKSSELELKDQKSTQQIPFLGELFEECLYVRTKSKGNSSNVKIGEERAMKHQEIPSLDQTEGCTRNTFCATRLYVNDEEKAPKHPHLCTITENIHPQAFNFNDQDNWSKNSELVVSRHEIENPFSCSWVNKLLSNFERQSDLDEKLDDSGSFTSHHYDYKMEQVCYRNGQKNPFLNGQTLPQANSFQTGHSNPIFSQNFSLQMDQGITSNVQQKPPVPPRHFGVYRSIKNQFSSEEPNKPRSLPKDFDQQPFHNRNIDLRTNKSKHHKNVTLNDLESEVTKSKTDSPPFQLNRPSTLEGIIAHLNSLLPEQFSMYEEPEKEVRTNHESGEFVPETIPIEDILPTFEALNEIASIKRRLCKELERNLKLRKN